MKVKPLHDRILIKRVSSEEKTAGGLIIPDTAKEKPQQGVVVAVGSGKVLEGGGVRPLQVEAGNRVLFAKYGGSEIKIGDQEHLILREDEVLAVVD
jgi:chaperonin GroES